MPESGPPTFPLPETLPGADRRGEVTYDRRLSDLAPASGAGGAGGGGGGGGPGGGGGGGDGFPDGPRGPFPERYALVQRIAGGAFGEVWRVRDHVLRRFLAMKVQIPARDRSGHLRARFLTEARLTAFLQHPGIVAVHDQGELEDGRVWFTMKEVRGRTLREAIAEVHEASGPEGFREDRNGWTFRRLIDAFARIAQAVAFAHSRGVMHRDLKPDNLMVGEFGEVLVMDWGLGRHIGDLEADADLVDGPVLADGSSDLTHVGDVLGTPAYMPPEQALGRRELHGAHSDVYALGAILYHLLSGRVPYEGADALSVLRQVINGPPRPLAEVLRVPVPDELVALCRRAMEREISDRFGNADVLAREVVAFLEGARRREQALAVLATAGAVVPEIASLRAASARHRDEAQALLAEVQAADPVEKKRPGWDLEDEAARLGRLAALRETEWLQTVHGALVIHPDLPEAHAVLADHYRDRLASAEGAHHDEDAARFEALLRSHDRGRHAAFLRGEGTLTLVTDPPGAVVRAERFEPWERRLVPVDQGVIGVTPLLALPLLRGSYRLRVQAPGRAEVVIPALIERGGHWDGVAPGAAETAPVVLPIEGALGPDDRGVPAGWCWIGGDPFAAESLPRRRVWIDGFVMRRFPVTNQEYLDFLNDLVASGRADEALAACPKSVPGRRDAGEPELPRDPEGRFHLLPGEHQPDAPVVAVDWYGAAAYARWLAARTGRAWRLPNELEREKAARGVDGRFCPWGDHLDATFACTVDSSAGNLVLAPVTSYPLDESPYGVRGLGGNTRDWCHNVWRHGGPRLEGDRLVLDLAGDDDAGPTVPRAVRGGGYISSVSMSRSACRFALHPALRRSLVGLRLVRPW